MPRSRGVGEAGVGDERVICGCPSSSGQPPRQPAKRVAVVVGDGAEVFARAVSTDHDSRQRRLLDAGARLNRSGHGVPETEKAGPKPRQSPYGMV